jgi:hypothetical protein
LVCLLLNPEFAGLLLAQQKGRQQVLLVQARFLEQALAFVRLALPSVLFLPVFGLG